MDGLDALAAEQAELERLAEEAREYGTSDGGALVPTQLSPEKARAELAARRAEAGRRAAAVQAQADRVKAVIEEQAREAKAMMREAQRALEPMQEMMRRLEEGIWTVNLYLGTREEIVQLRDGRAAPAEEVITVRQLVLSMDQECAVAAESGGIDALDRDRFDAWLLEDPAHLHQVLPEQKGVVALVPRAEDPKNHGSPLLNMKVEEMNAQTYLLIRNGEKLWRVCPDLIVGERLIPSSNEFTKLFEKRDPWNPDAEVEVLKPGTEEWSKAAERMEARERHYMRVALILQGLTDRTPVFHPLPPAGVSFLEPQYYEEERVRFILDADRALGTGREPFRDWQRRLMGELRVGMRVVGNFAAYGGGFRAEEYESSRWGPHGHRRLHPSGAAYPETHALYRIEDERRNGKLVFRYPRGEVYDPDLWVETRPGWGYRGGERPSKQRASCVVERGDDWIIPFDLVTTEEVEGYLAARTERRAYVDMFPLLKAVLRLKRGEEEAEAPFRVMLAGVLARENDVSVSAAETDLDLLVGWWKGKNRDHRALTGTEEENAKAVREITAEHRRVLEDRRRPIRPEVMETLRVKHPDALVIVRPRSGGYLVLDPAEPGRTAYVHEAEYSARGELRERRDWRLVRNRQTRWTVAYEGPLWKGWDVRATVRDAPTAPERAELTETIREKHQDVEPGQYEGPLLAVTYDAGTFRAWMRTGAEPDGERPLTGGHAREPEAHGQEYRWVRGPWGPGDLERGGLRVGRGWNSRRHRFEKTDWAWEEDGVEVLHRDEERIAELEQAIERARAVGERRGALEMEAGALRRSIEDQWLALRERGRYEAFLREYVDPALWEGHAKGLKPLRWEYPSHADSLWRAVARAVEEGRPAKGLTVRELWEAVRGEDEDFEGPEDALDLTVGAEAIRGPWTVPGKDE